MNRTYRGKLVEENLVANNSLGNYFKELSPISIPDVSVTVSLPYSPGCPVIPVAVDQSGIFAFNMTVLNGSIPYTIRVQATRKAFPPIVFDYFVGGYPLASVVEMGTYAFY